MDRKEMIAEAESLGLEFKKNISNEALETLLSENDPDAELNKAAKEAEARNKKLVEEATPIKSKAASLGNVKAQARKDAMKLIRCVVTAMDKDKAELSGEIISAGNSMTGMVKKFIPFGKEWHIPQILVDTLKDKKMWTTTDRRTAKGTIKENTEISAYNVQVLGDLSQDELNRIIKESK